MNNEGVGYGKTILFGEHFVVYGLPAVASAIGHKTIARVEDARQFEFVDNRPETPGYKAKKRDEISRQVEALRKHFSLDSRKPVKITLSGDLVCASGVGASAALAASISRALNEHFKLGLSDEEINKAAYIAEEAGSGTPSGIDNTCSVYGGFMIFQKNLAGGPNKIEKISAKKPIEIVMANSGITQETKKVVEDVRRLKEDDSKKFEAIFGDYRKVFDEGVKAIKNGDLTLLGSLMNENQRLLAEMTLSCREVDEIITAAKNAGVLGVKLTGTGRGGSVIALTPGGSLQNKVAAAIEKAGYKTLKTKIGV